MRNIKRIISGNRDVIMSECLLSFNKNSKVSGDFIYLCVLLDCNL